VEFFSAREIPRTEDIYMFREGAPLLGIGVWKVDGFGFPFGVLFPLAVIGIVGFRKRIPGPVWLLLLLYPLAVIVIFVSSRYRVPILPVICLLSAAGITWIYELVKGKKWMSLGIVSAVLCAMAFLISLPGPFIEEKMDLRAEYQLSEGMYYNRIGNYDSAIGAFKRALELDPCYVKAEYMLGVLYSELNRNNEAEAELNKILNSPLSCFFNNTGISDNNRYIDNHTSGFNDVYSMVLADTHEILGNIMLSENRLDDAVPHYQEAIAISPPRLDVIEVLADIRLKQKNYNEALFQLKQLLSYNAENPSIYSKLGLAYKETGDTDNAITYFSKAIELEPENPSSYYSIGNIYSDKNDFKKAIEYFQAVLKISPVEPFVLYNLGLSYMKLGDNKSAESAFIKSLQIKPGNSLVMDALEKVTGK
jgi:tetratricopeptide (TPR) repeat protein